MDEVAKKVKRWRQKGEVGPSLIELTLTYRCNLNCRFCNIPLHQESHTPDSEIDFVKVIQQIVDNYSNPLKFFLSGGEPLLRRDILPIMSKIKSAEAKGLMVTNGTLLRTQQAERIVDLSWDQLIFSIDGPQRIHDSLRGKKGAFKSTKKAMELINDLKENETKAKPRLQLSTVLCRQNIGDLDRVADLANDLNVYLVDFSELRGLRDCVEDIKVSADEKRTHDKLVEVKGQLEAYGIENNLDFLLESEDQQFVGPSQTKDRNQAPACYAPWYQLSVNPEGRVAPCSALIDSQKYSFDLREKEIAGIWSQDFSNIRQRLFEGDLPPECENCCMPYEKQNKVLERELTTKENKRLRQIAFKRKESPQRKIKSKYGLKNVYRWLLAHFNQL